MNTQNEQGYDPDKPTPQEQEIAAGTRLDQQGQAIAEEQQQIIESQKTALDKAMEFVVSAAFDRNEEIKTQEASATAYFLDDYIKKKQAKELNEKLSVVRRSSEIRNLSEPIIEMDYEAQVDSLFNADTNEYDGSDAAEEEEIRIADENIKHYQRARDSGHIDYVNETKRAHRYYKGDQWEQQDLDYLKEVGRPALTINRILSIVNSILSLKLKETTTFTAQAISFEDVQVAEVLTKLLLYVCRNCNYTTLENKVFKDCVLTGRGFAELRVSFDRNVEGDITIKRLNPEEVLLDPDSTGSDPKEWGQVITTKWLSLNDVALQYGNKKSKRVAEFSSVDSPYLHDDMFVFSEDSSDTFGNYPLGTDGAYYHLDPKENRQIKCVRVISRQYKKFKVVPHFLDPTTKECKPVPHTWDTRKIQVFSAKNGYFIISKKMEAVRWTTTAGTVVLQDTWSPYKTFTILPLFCYTSDTSTTFGVVSNLISPQEQLNKIESQETHVINTTANSGWLVEEDSLVNMTAEELAYKGSKNGLVLETKRTARSQPVKIQPNNVPPGLANASARASENITTISGIDGAFMGIGKANNTSSATLERKLNQVKDSYSVLNEQLRVFRENVGMKLIELIQDFYDDTRVFCITDPRKPDAGFEKLVINQPHVLEDSIINDISIGSYSINIANQPGASSLDNVLFEQIIKMKEIGIGIPSYRAILASDLLNKDDIAEEVRSLEGLTPPSEEEQQMQQMQMQAQMQQMQLSLQKLNAEIQQITANAMLANAKAQMEADRPNLENVAHQAKLAEAQMNNQLRSTLSQNASQTEITKAVMHNRTELEKERIRTKGNHDGIQKKAMHELGNKVLSSGVDAKQRAIESDLRMKEDISKERAKALYQSTPP